MSLGISTCGSSPILTRFYHTQVKYGTKICMITYKGICSNVVEVSFDVLFLGIFLPVALAQV